MKMTMETTESILSVSVMELPGAPLSSFVLPSYFSSVIESLRRSTTRRSKWKKTRKKAEKNKKGPNQTIKFMKHSTSKLKMKNYHDGLLIKSSPLWTVFEKFFMMDRSRQVLHFHHSIIQHSPRNGRRPDSPLYLT